MLMKSFAECARLIPVIEGFPWPDGSPHLVELLFDILITVFTECYQWAAFCCTTGIQVYFYYFMWLFAALISSSDFNVWQLLFSQPRDTWLVLVEENLLLESNSAHVVITNIMIRFDFFRRFNILLVNWFSERYLNKILQSSINYESPRENK